MRFQGEVTSAGIARIIELGKQQISTHNPLLPGVPGVLALISRHYRLIVATKGDLLDQERKLRNSGISGFFHHVEIMSDKTEKHYRRLLHHLDVHPGEFLMVGNSLRSDVLPVLTLGDMPFMCLFRSPGSMRRYILTRCPAAIFSRSIHWRRFYLYWV